MGFVAGCFVQTAALRLCVAVGVACLAHAGARVLHTPELFMWVKERAAEERGRGQRLHVDKSLISQH